MISYAYIGSPEILNSSASGGAYMAIAKAFFEQYPDGISFGVTLRGTEVVYEKAYSYEECKKFQGSKYVQCALNGVPQELCELIRARKAVLFTGTPCQVAIVRKRMEREHLDENIWFVDLICHGTVEDRVWKDYIRWLEDRYHSKVIEYSFRYKKIAWRGYPVYVRFENGRELLDTYIARTYIRAYLKQLIIRKGCLNCPFKTSARTGDFTIGDFWGIEKTLPEIYNEKGVSLILVNTEKGKSIINGILENKLSNHEKLVEVRHEHYIDQQKNLSETSGSPDQYEEFWSEYERRGFESAIKGMGILTMRGLFRYHLICIARKTGIYKYLKRVKNRLGGEVH